MPVLKLSLVAQAMWELARYDLLIALFGFKRIHNGISRCPRRLRGPETGLDTAAICEAMAQAVTVYWKRVRCLQRSAATARLLRRHGIEAELVISFRAAPFFGHAWVEVHGHVVNDSQAYRGRLYALERI